LWCLATFLVAPLGWFLPRRCFRRADEQHLEHGLVLIFPGIEGYSFLNYSLLQGLIDARLPYALEVVDWTTGWKPLILYHLRAWRRNRRVAGQMADRIVAYQRKYPGRPVWIVGHSGGGGMALLTAEALPEGVKIAGLVLLAAAVSPGFDVRPALRHVEHGIWSFHSWLDCLFVGVGTTLFGCFDGRHGPAAGMVGFRQPPEKSAAGIALIQTRHAWSMLRQFHAGGHFGCVHRVFVAETVAPVLQHRP
jgi:pimeloyl-ACP methyl ester carboxylesterase